MALRFLGVLAPAQLEDLHLVAAAVADDGGLDERAGDEGRADLDAVTRAHQQHLIERDVGADFGGERLDAELGPGFDAILLAAGLDHCVHCFLPRPGKAENYKGIMSFVSMLAPVADDLRAVDELIGQRLESDVPLVRQVAQYLVAAGGKRLRPALLLLACGALGYRGEARLTLAAVVEFIHTATLLHDHEVDEARYLEVIRRKTAKLFEAAARLGAVLARSTPPVEQGLASYGAHVGTAFQLIDDVLDYSGDEAAIGKSLGDDLAEGKPTLPLIYAMRSGTAQQAAVIRKAIEDGGREDLPGVLTVIRECGALDYARAAAGR